MKDVIILGWEEWIALPDLGLVAIKAKVDTGAKTSALHAFVIEPFGPPGRPSVRFGVHPAPRRPEIELFCSAPVIDARDVTSSNGERERRYVIATTLAIGGYRSMIEITLTNRAEMSYRMLLGRQALQAGMLVDPANSFHQPRLGYKLYRVKRKKKPA
jgi:ribosomal protein S6--L-glutamate ligase